jgi:RNA polymerase sigma-70 factor (family 1)
MTAEHKILPKEKELFTQMALGDQQAFAKIFYHYTQRIYGFILSKTKSEELTEEIVQEVFIDIWEKRQMIKDVHNYESYIFTMAVNKTYRFLQNIASEEKLRSQVWASMQTFSNITNETLDLKYSEQLINEAIEQLSPQRKKVFVLSKKEGLSRHQIAEQLNVSVNTVDNQLREALISIKNYLKKTPGVSVILLMILIRINQ